MMRLDPAHPLGDEWNRFIDEEVENGRFAAPEDVIRAGLRLLQERQQQLAALQAAIAAGDADIAAGRIKPIDSAEAFAADIVARGRRRLAQKRS